MDCMFILYIRRIQCPATALMRIDVGCLLIECVFDRSATRAPEHCSDSEPAPVKKMFETAGKMSAWFNTKLFPVYYRISGLVT